MERVASGFQAGGHHPGDTSQPCEQIVSYICCLLLILPVNIRTRGKYRMAGTTEAGHSEAITCKIQGNINYRQENFEAALLFYEKGLEIDPENIDIWNNKGLTLVKLGRIEEARQCKREMKRLGKNQGALHTTSPTVTTDETEKPKQCTFKIKGVNGNIEIIPAPVTPDVTVKARQHDLQFRDIEQNIESIKNGLDKVRLSRIEEAEQCKLQITEMEETIEQTKLGLNLVKKGRIEEARRIKYIEEHIELTKKGLEQIKTGRIEEATHYSQQLEAIEEKIELTRNSLKQVKEGEAENVTIGNTGATVTAGNTKRTKKISAPASPAVVGEGTENAHQIKDIEDIIGLPDETDQPATPGKNQAGGCITCFFHRANPCILCLFQITGPRNCEPLPLGISRLTMQMQHLCL